MNCIYIVSSVVVVFIRNKLKKINKFYFLLILTVSAFSIAPVFKSLLIDFGIVLIIIGFLKD